MMIYLVHDDYGSGSAYPFSSHEKAFNFVLKQYFKEIYPSMESNSGCDLPATLLHDMTTLVTNKYIEDYMWIEALELDKEDKSE